jgi:L-glutamine-phosphate cytidylyltransferase
MNLVILASGMGKRLNKKLPKCLVNINDKTLLERILNFSKEFDKVIIVGGYKVNLLKKIIKNQNRKNIYLINNKDYKTTNMVESFFKAYNKVNQDVIISYSDIIFDSSLFKKMINYNKNHLLLKSNWKKVWMLRMSEKKIKLDAEDIQVKKRTIINIGSKINHKLPKYQFMGLIRFNKKDIKKIKSFYLSLKNKKIDFTSFLNSLIQSKVIRMNFQETNKFWFEIDTIKDLNALKSTNYKI